ncbi:MAG: hypothetical protein HQL71_00325 [Magnetococcales bacterium]|nr:hypothetical protein [Magnetococcales bacterium]
MGWVKNKLYDLIVSVLGFIFVFILNTYIYIRQNEKVYYLTIFLIISYYFGGVLGWSGFRYLSDGLRYLTPNIPISNYPSNTIILLIFACFSIVLVSLIFFQLLTRNNINGEHPTIKRNNALQTQGLFHFNKKEILTLATVLFVEFSFVFLILILFNLYIFDLELFANLSPMYRGLSNSDLHNGDTELIRHGLQGAILVVFIVYAYFFHYFSSQDSNKQLQSIPLRKSNKLEKNTQNNILVVAPIVLMFTAITLPGLIAFFSYSLSETPTVIYELIDAYIYGELWFYLFLLIFIVFLAVRVGNLHFRIGAHPAVYSGLIIFISVAILFGFEYYRMSTPEHPQGRMSFVTHMGETKTVRLPAFSSVKQNTTNHYSQSSLVLKKTKTEQYDPSKKIILEEQLIVTTKNEWKNSTKNQIQKKSQEDLIASKQDKKVIADQQIMFVTDLMTELDSLFDREAENPRILFLNIKQAVNNSGKKINGENNKNEQLTQNVLKLISSFVKFKKPHVQEDPFVITEGIAEPHNLIWKPIITYFLTGFEVGHSRDPKIFCIKNKLEEKCIYQSREAFVSSLKTFMSNYYSSNPGQTFRMLLNGTADQLPIHQEVNNSTNRFSSNYELARSRAERVARWLGAGQLPQWDPTHIKITSQSNDIQEKVGTPSDQRHVRITLLSGNDTSGTHTSTWKTPKDLTGATTSEPVSLTDTMFFSANAITTTGYGIMPVRNDIKLFTSLENLFEILIVSVFLAAAVSLNGPNYTNKKRQSTLNASTQENTN